MGERFVRLRPSASKPIQWTMIYEGDEYPAPPYPPIDLIRNNGAYFLVFTIKNPNGMDIEFADNDPIWVHKIDPSQSLPQCPSGPGIYDNQIKGWVRHGGKQLVVKDINKGDKLTLSYQLNFVDRNDPSHNVPPFDPQIKNGGGNGPGQGGNLVSAIAMSVAGAALGLCSALIGNSGLAAMDVLPFAIGGAAMGFVVGLVAERF